MSELIDAEFLVYVDWAGSDDALQFRLKTRIKDIPRIGEGVAFEKHQSGCGVWLCVKNVIHYPLSRKVTITLDGHDPDGSYRAFKDCPNREMQELESLGFSCCPCF